MPANIHKPPRLVILDPDEKATLVNDEVIIERRRRRLDLVDVIWWAFSGAVVLAATLVMLVLLNKWLNANWDRLFGGW